MLQCPVCARQQSPRLICSGCGAPLAIEVDYFSALDLPRHLVIDRATLERHYHELGRLIHPDKFAVSSAALRSASLAATALLTRAYRTLREPVARGLYWLELHGEKLATNNKNVPPELAELIFEVQDALEQWRDASHEEARAQVLRSELQHRRTAVGQELESAFGELQSNFARWDSGEEQNESRSLLTNQLKLVLSKIAYLRTLLRDMDRELEPAELS